MMTYSLLDLRLLRNWLISLVFVLLPTVDCLMISVYAQPLDPQLLEPGWEKWYDMVPAAGGVRVGVMAATGNETVDPNLFSVILPATDLPYLCVEVSAKDGRYEAILEYDIRNVKPGLIELNLPTEHKEHLSSYASKDLAMMNDIYNSGNDK